MSTKSEKILTLLNEGGKTQDAIAKDVGCSIGYVTQVKQAYARKQIETPENKETSENKETPETIPEVIDTGEIDNDVATFIKKIKIVPDKVILTDNDEPEDETEEYQCGSCGHVWVAGKTDYQTSCPGCGEEF